MIKEILRGEGIPEDLAYLPMIESGFDPRACSRRNAVGLWQLMRGTARKYGLRIDWWVDERRDPVKSTRAAARYLKDLYGMFGSWDLAIAAYNAGEGRIRRGVRRRKVERFWDLCRHRDIKRETKNFVPKFMAAVKIARDPEGYGFREIPYEEPWRFDLVKASEPLDLQTIARLVGTDQKEIRAFNPQLKRWCTPPGPPEVDLRVPEGTAQRFLEGLGELSLGERIHVRVHRVRPGETLSKIASRYGSRVDLIAKMNRLRSIHRIRAESQLLVPTPRRPVKEGSRVTSRGGSPGQRLKPKGGATRVPGQEEAIVHRVKRGETLWAISRRYGVQVSDIRRWNNLRGQHIRPGDELIVMKKES